MSAGAMMSPDQINEFKGLLTQIDTQYKQLDADYKKLGTAGSETVEKLNKLDQAVVALRSRVEEKEVKRIDAVEERLKTALAQQERLTPPKPIGEQFIGNEGFLSFIKSGSRNGFALNFPQSIYHGVKDITGLSALLPERLNAIAAGPRLPIGVRTLVPQGRTTAGAVQYVRETAFTNNANVVAEGVAKPKSDKTFTVATSAVTTIAHYFKISKQSYDDVPFIASQIEANGIYGVQLKEDQQLLNGNGTPPQLQGFMPVAAAAPAPGGTGATLVDAIGAAVFDLASKGYMADGTVVNPADWGGVAMLKNSQGNYLFASPMDYSGNSRIWGTRLVMTSSMTATNFLVGAFQGNSLLLDREEVTVQIASQNEDDFIKNMLTILIEERIALIIYNTAAFEKGTAPAPAGFAATPEQEPEAPARSRR